MQLFILMKMLTSQRLIKEGEKAGDEQCLVYYPKYKKGGAVAKEIKEACPHGNKLIH